MKSGSGGIGAAALAAALAGIGAASAGDKASPKPAPPPPEVETVFFADPLRAPVKVMRGGQHQTPPAERWGHTEIVNFGDDRRAVTVIHGGTKAANARPEPPAAARFETVTFSDAAMPAVTIIRGPAPPRPTWSVELFGPANGGELDRIAFAVDGVESRHGGDLRMWRPELDGPQGPMQVSAKAAIDVGGGNRFDLHENRQLGRAYLAQMYRRYGNWPDALGAYNWGPGNLDQWITQGRNPDRMPLETLRYIGRVLRDAMVTVAGRW